MRRNLWRITVALMLSIGGFMGTQYWFENSKDKTVARNRVSMAQLSHAVNEVQRKAVQRVIWESISKNDELYAGEALRTAPNAEAQILFKSGTVVRLAPDSLIVLEENAKGVRLDFLSGNMFIQNENKTDSLTVSTGQGDIDLKSVDLSLSKVAGGTVHLDIHSGSAEINQGQKKTLLTQQQSLSLSGKGIQVDNDHLKLLTPAPGQTQFLSHQQPLLLSWRPLPPGYMVEVELGKSRQQLNKSKRAPLLGSLGSAPLPIKPGAWQIRLTARDTKGQRPTLTSQVTSFQVEAKTPPQLTEPAADARVTVLPVDRRVTFHWVNRHQFQSQTFELTDDQNFKNIKNRAELSGELSTHQLPLENGIYYWRVTGKLKSEGLVSSILMFSVDTEKGVPQPALVFPADKSHHSLAQVRSSGLNFQWENGRENAKSIFKLEQKSGATWKTIRNQSTEASLLSLKEFTAGTFRWHVVALPEPPATKPVLSKVFEFNVEPTPILEWAHPAPSLQYEFTGAAPSLSLAWKAWTPPAGVEIKYRYQIAGQSESLDTSNARLTKQTSFSVNLESEGHYQARVEALTIDDHLLAQSAVKLIQVKRQVLLPAPQWGTATPDVIQSDSKGNLQVDWMAVDGAKHYLLILESAKGKVVKQSEILRTTASLTELQPGEYSVRLKSVDARLRPGPDSEIRKIIVPTPLKMRAPKIKLMKVK